MLRQIGSSHWDAALDYLKAHPVWEFIIVKNHAIPTQERLDEAIQNETWCYVIFRSGGNFEKVTYHNGKRVYVERE
jgi:hypothetical protein